MDTVISAWLDAKYLLGCAAFVERSVFQSDELNNLGALIILVQKWKN